MNNPLSTGQIRDANAVITQCEHLITARGQSGAQLGVYEADPFSIVFRADGEARGLQVRHRDRVVFRVQRDRVDSPGILVSEPGAWRGELLGISAAHS